MRNKIGLICVIYLSLHFDVSRGISYFELGEMFKYYFSLGIEWKKVYSLSHPSDLENEGFFEDDMDTLSKNPDDVNADMFSILDQLEQFRTCHGEFHFLLCYPELVENFTFPCNEWIQSNNPVYDSIIKDFKPIKITFESETQKFNGLGKAERGKLNGLIEDWPFLLNNRSFSIGTLLGSEGKVIGPPDHLVEKVELFVNPGN